MPVSALDLVNNTVEKKPSEFATNFSELVTDKVRDLIAGKRSEVAGRLFGGQPVVEPENIEPPEETNPAETEGENDEKETA